MSLYDDFLNWFDELEKEIPSKSNARDNQEDGILKLVYDVIANVEVHVEEDIPATVNSLNAFVGGECRIH